MKSIETILFALFVGMTPNSIDPVSQLTLSASEPCPAAKLHYIVGARFIRKGMSVDTDGPVLFERDLPEPYRVLSPGDATTMDFVGRRLNVHLDAQGRVMRVRCG
jgi:hypothetical protein